jgi:hypothetical protein
VRFITHASSVLPVYPKLLFLNFITYDYVPILKFCTVNTAPLLNLLLTSRAYKSLTYILLITVCIELYLLTSTYLLLSVGDCNKLRVARYLRTYLRTQYVPFRVTCFLDSVHRLILRTEHRVSGRASTSVFG